MTRKDREILMDLIEARRTEDWQLIMHLAWDILNGDKRFEETD